MKDELPKGKAICNACSTNPVVAAELPLATCHSFSSSKTPSSGFPDIHYTCAKAALSIPYLQHEYQGCSHANQPHSVVKMIHFDLSYYTKYQSQQIKVSNSFK